MLKKPKAKKLTAEEIEIINASSAQQTGKVQAQKTYDLDYPVFDIPINQKLLVYVPNHTVMNPDGSVSLRQDKFAAHAVIDGHNFGNIRCTYGVNVPSQGLDGSCPLCEATNLVWDLYHKDYEAIAKAKGIPVDSPEAKDGLADDRKELVKNMVIKQAEVWYTFPIVVIECTEKDGKLTTIPKKNSEGQIVGKPYFYSIREKTFTDKWLPAFDTIETDDGEVPTHAGGRWFILNFTYTPKSGQHTKMGSANNLKVAHKVMGAEYKVWEEYFDKLTEGWTPQKAQEVVVLDAFRDMEETQEIADALLAPVRDKLAIYSIGENNANKGAEEPAGVLGDAQDALAGFGATAVESTSSQGALPVEGSDVPPEVLTEQTSGVE